MKRVRFMICMILLSATMVSFAADEESKELKALYVAVAKAKDTNKGEKHVMKAEDAAKAVYTNHPEEIGTAHYYARIS